MLHPLHHQIQYAPHKREMRHLFWSDGVASIGASMVQLLIPAYLLTLGHSLPEVCLFFIIMYGGMVPMNWVVARLLGRFSPNVLMGVSNLLDIVSYTALLLLPVLGIPFWLPAITRAMSKGFYYLPFHLSFSKSRLRRKGDSQVGLMMTLGILAGGIAPAIGGVVASMFGIAWSYGLAAGLFVIATAIILRGADVARHRRFDRKLLSRKVAPDMAANALISGLDVVDHFAWPLFIFLLIKSYAGIGILSSVVVLTAAATALWVGRRADHHGERQYLKRGSWLASLTNGLRLLAASTVHVFSINLLNGVSRSLFYTTYLARYYKHADREPRLEYVWAMGTSYALGWTFFMLLLFGLASVLSVNAALAAIVILAVPLSFSVRLIR
jgi:hypothetical protein